MDLVRILAPVGVVDRAQALVDLVVQALAKEDAEDVKGLVGVHAAVLVAEVAKGITRLPTK